MDVSAAGRVNVPSNPEQPENALAPIEVTPSGIVKFPENLEQLENVLASIAFS